MKCQLCKQNEAAHAWQPFGPDENPREAFTALGHHYRGFPVIKVCDECRKHIKVDHVIFQYSGTEWILWAENTVAALATRPDAAGEKE